MHKEAHHYSGLVNLVLKLDNLLCQDFNSCYKVEIFYEDIIITLLLCDILGFVNVILQRDFN